MRKYIDIMNEDQMVDTLRKAGGFSGPDWHDGYWITDSGDVLSCDYENDVHHAEIVAGIMQDGENAIEAATRAGWIRVHIIPNRQFMIEFNPEKAQPRAFRVLSRAIRDADVNEYLVDLPNGYERATTAPEFIGILRRMLVSANGLKEAVDELISGWDD